MNSSLWLSAARDEFREANDDFDAYLSHVRQHEIITQNTLGFVGGRAVVGIVDCGSPIFSNGWMLFPHPRTSQKKTKQIATSSLVRSGWHQNDP
ncbi:MAG: hypothetical protein ABJH63_20120 [Rhizobiaceae bacterium]